VTGGAGFLGAHLCERLLTDGWRVVCVDNLVTGVARNVAHLRPNKSFETIQHNVSEPLYLEGPVDAILHFASPASPVDYADHPIATLKVGTLGTHNMLGLAKLKNARYLVASTSEVYGDPDVHPQSEQYWGNVNCVGTPSIYDEAKRCAEAFVMAYHNTHGMDTRIVRIFNTYGPRMRRNDGRASVNFLNQALENKPLTVYGDGSQTRSFMYVDDLVEGIWRLMSSIVTDPINIGNPQEMTLLELAKRIIRLASSRSEIRFDPLPEDDPKVRQPDITRALTLLGWEPRVDTDEGLRLTLSWFRRKLDA